MKTKELHLAEINKLAKQFIEGEWLYSTSDKILKKNFADSEKLKDLHLIDEDGYLNEALKTEIKALLGDTVLQQSTGPFGDEDIFSGEIFEELTQYNIELHQLSEATLDALQKIPKVTIKIID